MQKCKANENLPIDEKSYQKRSGILLAFYGNLEHNVKKKSDRFKKGVVTYIYDYIYESEPYGAPMASRQVPLWTGIWSHSGNLQTAIGFSLKIRTSDLFQGFEMPQINTVITHK